MKCVINIAMAVMLLAGFQQASADVCKLKVKKEIVDKLETHDEVWVDKDNGEVLNKLDKRLPKLGEGRRNFVHIVKNSINAFAANGSIKKEYKDAIFCNAAKKHKRNRVIISVGGAKDKQAEAKRQFENIIKCGLVNDSVINRQIYDTPFKNPIIDGTKVTKWQMPGISADISDLNVTEIPVMCAMKMDTKTYVKRLPLNTKVGDQTIKQYALTILEQDSDVYKQVDEIEQGIVSDVDWLSCVMSQITQKVCDNFILKRGQWSDIFSRNNVSLCVNSIEHSERQLMLYHLFNVDLSRLSDCAVNINGQMKGNGNKSLLIYTNGAPCFEEGNGKMVDNGGKCCWEIYRLVPENIHVDVYFSVLSATKFTKADEMRNMFNFSDRNYINSVCDVLNGVLNINIDNLYNAIGGNHDWQNVSSQFDRDIYRPDKSNMEKFIKGKSEKKKTVFLDQLMQLIRRESVQTLFHALLKNDNSCWKDNGNHNNVTFTWM